MITVVKHCLLFINIRNTTGCQKFKIQVNCCTLVLCVHSYLANQLSPAFNFHCHIQKSMLTVGFLPHPDKSNSYLQTRFTTINIAMKLKVNRMVNMYIAVFWNVTPSSLYITTKVSTDLLRPSPWEMTTWLHRQEDKFKFWLLSFHLSVCS